MANTCVIARQKVNQTQMPSRRAETYPPHGRRPATRGVEIECFLPQSTVQELGISIGSYHHGHPLP
ncbi:MAG TPA: hypothetical protein VM223_19335 [Planctomycetota bacterium]|nr:hypothetical protein [Planctomycetota bacterium]